MHIEKELKDRELKLHRKERMWTNLKVSIELEE